MTEIDIGNLRDLVGRWSCLTLGLGLAGAFLSYLSRKQIIRWVDREPAKLFAKLAAAMAAFACYLALHAMPIAYSGGDYWNDVHKWSYDKFLAAGISLTFGVIFAIDAVRFRK